MAWLAGVPLEAQYASAVSVGEIYKGAYRASRPERYLAYIEDRLLASITVLPYDVAVAKVFGKIRAGLEASGQTLEDADLQIAATALHHDLELVTGNPRHFRRIPGLRLSGALARGHGGRPHPERVQ